jgi:hypothetical protein
MQLSLPQTSQRGRERKREGGIERERERDVEYGCFIFIFKMNDGCLGTTELYLLVI